MTAGAGAETVTISRSNKSGTWAGNARVPTFFTLTTLTSRLFLSVDGAALAAFRIAFGLLMAWEAVRFFVYGSIGYLYAETPFNFTYYGFEWVKPLPGIGMYVIFAALGILALCIAAGLLYRVAAALFFVLFAYVFLLDQAQYLNHFYLITLLSFWLVFIPANRLFSLDARLGLAMRSSYVPAWTYFLLRVQIAIVYIYAGIAKLNVDWLRAEPMRTWLAERTDFPVIGGLFTQEWVVHLASYGALLFDLGVVFLLLWRRTRWIGFAAALTFHLMNTQLFNIGVFPWLMIAATTLFFEPGWVRFGRSAPEVPTDLPLPSRRVQRFVLVTLIVYLVVQLLIPLRHFFYPGEVNWTEAGHRFSWHMLLRTKRGETRFFVTDPASNATWEIDPRDYLTVDQIGSMSTRPDMIAQFARYAADFWESQGVAGAQVRVWSMLGLNGRAPQLLIDPTVDLAAQTRSPGLAPYVLPLMQPSSAETAAPVLHVAQAADALVLTNAGQQPFPLTALTLRAGDETLTYETWRVQELNVADCIVLQFVGGQTPNLICNVIIRLPIDQSAFFAGDSFTAALDDQAAQVCNPACLIAAPPVLRG